MSGPQMTPLFIDTGPLLARFVTNASRHDRATAVFDAIRSGDLRYRPLYTSAYVLDELATLFVRRSTPSRAVDVVGRIQESQAITIIHPDADDFDATVSQLDRYNDQTIEFTDHMSAVLAADRAVGHVFTFDSTDFRTLGFMVVPADTGDG